MMMMMILKWQYTLSGWMGGGIGWMAGHGRKLNLIGNYLLIFALAHAELSGLQVFQFGGELVTERLCWVGVGG